MNEVIPDPVLAAVAWDALYTLAPYTLRGAMYVPREKFNLEFFAYETMGGAETDIAGLSKALDATDEADLYRHDQGVKYDPGGMYRAACFGYTSIKVLQDLWGLPFNNLTMAYIRGLQPTKVRACQGGTADMCTGRVTVWLESDGKTISSIDQEIRIGYSSGADVGAVLHARKRGEEPKPPGNVFGHTKGLERASFD